MVYACITHNSNKWHNLYHDQVAECLANNANRSDSKVQNSIMRYMQLAWKLWFHGVYLNEKIWQKSNKLIHEKSLTSLDKLVCAH